MPAEGIGAIFEFIPALLEALAGFIVAVIQLAAMAIELLGLVVISAVELLVIRSQNRSGARMSDTLRARLAQRKTRVMERLKGAGLIIVLGVSLWLLILGWGYAGSRRVRVVLEDRPAVASLEVNNWFGTKRLYCDEDGYIRVPRLGDFTLRTTSMFVRERTWNADEVGDKIELEKNPGAAAAGKLVEKAWKALREKRAGTE